MTNGTSVQITATPTIPQPVTPPPTPSPIPPTPTVLPLPTRIVQKPEGAVPPQPEEESGPRGEKIAETAHFEFYAEDGYFPVTVDEFKNQAENVYDDISARLNASTEKKIPVTFHRPSAEPCSPRGLVLYPPGLILIFADEQTSQEQILGVLAHEVGHILHLEGDFAGGTPALYEGLATWAASEYWNAWHGSPSLEASVMSYLAQDTFLPLYENYEEVSQTSTLTSEACLARRDTLYTEWAAFIDYLIKQYGWEKLHTLFGMPIFEERGNEIIIKPPDFQGVYGSSLNQLEAAWLAYLMAEAANTSLVVPGAQEDRDGAGQVINLVSREITLEELTRLAPFTILWPQNLPDGYQILRIMEMSESATESSNSGTFILEYAHMSDQNKPLAEQGRLFIWQTLDSNPDLSQKQPTGTLNLAGEEISLYQEGQETRAFFERGQVSLELLFWGVPVEDVEKIASSLTPS